MRIGDWSSDVCSSDLDSLRVALGSVCQHRASHERLAGYAIVREPLPRTRLGKYRRFLLPEDRESVVSGKRVPDGVDIGGRRIINTQLRYHVLEHYIGSATVCDCTVSI